MTTTNRFYPIAPISIASGNSSIDLVFMSSVFKSGQLDKDPEADGAKTDV